MGEKANTPSEPACWPSFLYLPWAANQGTLGGGSALGKGTRRAPILAGSRQQSKRPGFLGPKSSKMVQNEGKETSGQGLSKRHVAPSGRRGVSPHPSQSLVQELQGPGQQSHISRCPSCPSIFHREFRGQGKTGSRAQSCRFPFYSTKPAGGGGGGGPEAPNPGKKSGGWGCPGDPITLTYKDMGSPHLGPCRARLAQGREGSGIKESGH